jgi:hypothetical protein
VLAGINAALLCGYPFGREPVTLLGTDHMELPNQIIRGQ